uniref:Uncharacterized protein n=1 Tax=Knipowitschia caucasica TaxID=637954 RepID=A0AAV2KA84_KNICA
MGPRQRNNHQRLEPNAAVCLHFAPTVPASRDNLQQRRRLMDVKPESQTPFLMLLVQTLYSTYGACYSSCHVPSPLRDSEWPSVKAPGPAVTGLVCGDMLTPLPCLCLFTFSRTCPRRSERTGCHEASRA